MRAERDRECRIIALELLDGLGAEGVAAGAALREESRAHAPDAGPATLEVLRRDADA